MLDLLLTSSKHDNIVKYIGFVKSADCLNIILEYTDLNLFVPTGADC